MDVVRSELGPDGGVIPAEGQGAAMSPRLSRIVVLVPSDRVRSWAARLVDVLRRQSGLPTTMLRTSWATQSSPAIPAEGLEGRLIRGGPSGQADWMATDGVDEAEGVPWSQTLVVNATEHDPATFPPALLQGLILSPTFHGAWGVHGVVKPLLSGETVRLGVVASLHGVSRDLQLACAATPERAVMRYALHLLLGRMITILEGAAKHVLSGRELPDSVPRPPAPQGVGPDYWWRLAGAALPRVGRALRKPFVRHDWWCVGIRRLERESSPSELDLEPAGFQILDAGPDRFYADPFVLRFGRVTALFFEDYDYATGRAAISYLALDEEGPVGLPAPALSRPYHLSYPFVFAHEGAALMIPETSENRTIELYEAADFPDHWRLRAVLMEDVDASDTTVHFDGRTGLWWMFSAVSEFGSSSHDTLSIFYSERLEGPWRPHAGNPVKLDPGSSRPAGALLSWDGRLLRPTQDCTRAYGEAVVWCEIEDLTPDSFQERPVARQGPGRGVAGVHTYGRAAGFEVVDFKRNRSRLTGRERRL